METMHPSYDLVPEIDEDTLKVAHFIASNVPPHKVHKVARWVSDMAPLLWPAQQPAAGALHGPQTPISILRMMR